MHGPRGAEDLPRPHDVVIGLNRSVVKGPDARVDQPGQLDPEVRSATHCLARDQVIGTCDRFGGAIETNALKGPLSTE